MLIKQEADKYKNYYVPPKQWFRTDYEIIHHYGLSNVKCVLCYKTTGLFLTQVNVYAKIVI